jgi:hypothetical protein
MRKLTVLTIVLLISSCSVKRENGAQTEESLRQEFLRKGGEIAKAAQGELQKNVSRAMGQGGPVYAIEFCSERAMALKDSLSRLNDCEISRIALKYRNPEDMPRTKTEKEQLDRYEAAHLKGDSIRPEVYLFEDRIEYYQPIFLGNGVCLVCHGDPGEHIAAETLEIIEARYPDDRATGFALNDFRGAWKITFTREAGE